MEERRKGEMEGGWEVMESEKKGREGRKGWR